MTSGSTAFVADIISRECVELKDGTGCIHGIRNKCLFFLDINTNGQYKMYVPVKRRFHMFAR